MHSLQGYIQFALLLGVCFSMSKINKRKVEKIGKDVSAQYDDDIDNDFYEEFKGLNIFDIIMKINGNETMPNITRMESFTRESMKSISAGNRKSGKPMKALAASDDIQNQNETMIAMSAISAVCQPRDTVVEMKSSGYREMFEPHCVILKRCAGCCRGNNMKCTPISTSKTTRTFFKLNLSKTRPIRIEKIVSVVKELTEHSTCACKCSVTKDHCRKRQYYSKNFCQCRCMGEVRKCPGRTRWNEKSCKCKCLLSKKDMNCSHNQYYNKKTCRCVHKKKKVYIDRLPSN